MRILRGLSSRVLFCGCVAGLYETYDGSIVAIIDVLGSTCGSDGHRVGKVLPVDEAREITSATNAV